MHQEKQKERLQMTPHANELCIQKQQENEAQIKITPKHRMEMRNVNIDSDQDVCNFLDSAHKSYIEVKVDSLGGVELSALLVHPPAVNTAAEIAFVHPVLENGQ